MNGLHEEGTRRTIERVARESYGRLVAYLSVQTHDLASAEDALGNALVSALNRWPKDGVPQHPENWLLTAARHSLIDDLRHRQVVEASEPTLQLLKKDIAEAALPNEFPDERLKLLFVCAHPAIDPAMHTPLMLQTVLGLEAARIAQAFLVAPATMGQRLSRAKVKIRSGGIPFEIPEARDLPERVEGVLEAIYAAFGIGWDDLAGADKRGSDLVEEALWLSRALLELLPDEPEVRGLLALMLFCDARRETRRAPDGRYVPLSEQDPAAWSQDRVREAEAQLARAAPLGRPGRFQLEAAIQSVHAERAQTGRTDWAAIVVFYEHLVRLAPTLGVRVAQAAAVAEAEGPAEGLAKIEAIDPGLSALYQPYWAVRAHLLRTLGRSAPAAEAYDRAIGLTEDPAIRRFLLARRG